jgi:hypothetical protein
MLKTAGATLALSALPGRLLGQQQRRPSPALAVVYLNGGPCGLFNSADSFLENGGFGVTRDNVRDLGNGLVVDAGTFGTLPDAALGHMASVSFRHGLYQHDLARAALLQTGDRSNLLLLAQSMQSPAPVRCAVVNSLGLPGGVDASPPHEGGIGLERVLDLRTIGNFGGEPVARTAAAYGVAHDASTIADGPTSLLAAELLLRAGTNVVFTQPLYAGRPDRQLDTHKDSSGAQARAIMGTLMPSLRTFVGRMLAFEERQVVVALVGEFSRTLGASDHEPGGTATIIGRRVKTGSAGRQTADGAPPPGSPPIAGLWSFIASALGLAEHEFGANPHPQLVLG